MCCAKKHSAVSDGATRRQSGTSSFFLSSFSLTTVATLPGPAQTGREYHTALWRPTSCCVAVRLSTRAGSANGRREWTARAGGASGRRVRVARSDGVQTGRHWDAIGAISAPAPWGGWVTGRWPKDRPEGGLVAGSPGVWVGFPVGVLPPPGRVENAQRRRRQDDAGAPC